MDGTQLSQNGTPCKIGKKSLSHVGKVDIVFYYDVNQGRNVLCDPVKTLYKYSHQKIEDI